MSEPSVSTEEQPQESSPTTQQRLPTLPALLVVQGVFLLLLGLGGFFGWQLWQQYGLLSEREGQQKIYLGALQVQLEDSRRELNALQSRLSALPDAHEQLNQQKNQLEQFQQSQQALQKTLQDEQQQLKERLAQLRGQQVWQLNEALYQMRLAQLRLEVMQDVDSALLLLKNADELLAALQDPAALITRKRLAEALQPLAALSQQDRSAQYLKLAALRSEAATLNNALPTFAPDEITAKADNEPPSYWQQWRETLAHYVRIDFDSTAQDIRPLLAGQSLAQARLALILALEQAQWGLLHGEQAVYQQALKQAGEVLTLAFNPQAPSTQSLQTHLAELAAQPVATPMPDLAPLLSSMQTYMRQRQQAEMQGNDEAPENKP